MDRYLVSIVTEQVVIGSNDQEDNTSVHVVFTDTAAEEQVSVPLELVVQFADFLRYQAEDEEEVETPTFEQPSKRMVVKRSEPEE